MIKAKIKINGIKTTCNVPDSLCEEKPNLIIKICAWLSLQWLLKTSGIRLWWMYEKDKIARRKYCNKGYHKIHSSTVIYKHGDKRAQKFQFIKCRHCNYMFFPTKAQKERYINYEKKTREQFFAGINFLSGTETGLSKRSGKKNISEGSVKSSHNSKSRGTQ